MFENVSKWPKAFPHRVQRPLERLVKPVGDLQWDFSRNQPVALHTLLTANRYDIIMFFFDRKIMEHFVCVVVTLSKLNIF